MSGPAPILTGFRQSVYTRVVRIALAEKGVAHDYEEHDPFAPDAQGPHPFGRVPVLRHGDFRIYETAAITDYIDRAFDGPALMPEGARPAARVAQVIGIVDAYGYWPLVRQVYSHAVYRPALGEPCSSDIITEGLASAPRVLCALDSLVEEGLVLAGGFTRADCHLAPMIAAFSDAPQGAAMLGDFPRLAAWWAAARERPSVMSTQTPLSPGGPGR
ncbi:glutathione S-transferase family protein [Marimonas lutisalis]|uniref:glutathione S-transferase family protein n=1 Tax=Marimonas lutisalis TaxID=2545756 RepID=UPI0010FA1319|nr:glutathione S-transferase family protein [Marimonas lutisalis]